VKWLSDISTRHSRRIASVLLLSYTALILLLSLHHHHPHDLGPGVEYRGEGQSDHAHGHLEADCPLLHYAVSAFLSVPVRPVTAIILESREVTDTPESQIIPSVLDGDRLSRAPPTTT
jgi:hypothetical protein